MLTKEAIDFLEARKLDPEMADHYGIYGRPDRSGGKSVLVFPYREGDIVVNEKFRLLPKGGFWQHSGRKKIFWNADVLDDPALAEQSLVITEGELDALAAIQCGWPWAVSVPDGAPPASPNDDSDYSGAQDQDGKYSFYWNHRDKLDRVKRFILALDNDPPGQRLRKELTRLLLPSRCSFVEYPLGCKDLNDVLVKHGAAAVVRTINEARPCPVQGLYRLDDYPIEAEEMQTFSTGWQSLDRNCKLFLGEFCVVTGIPQHGKSSFVLHLLVNLARIHGLRATMFSPEMRIVPMVRNRLRSIYTDRAPELAGQPEITAWVQDNFTFIGSDPKHRDEENDFDLNWILERASDAIRRDGARVVVIDPWNEVEHARRKDQTLTEYVGWAIRKMKRFAQLYNVIMIVVAHPTKMGKNKEGKFEIPSLYDISDSSNWFNKCDHGIVVYRNFDPPNTLISIAKSRFDEAGEGGSVKMMFDQITHRFSMLDGHA